MTPQRRVALGSIAAACLLIVLKLTAGIESGSLGLVSEAVHSGTDLVAALLTFFGVGVAGRPADRGHPYGHGKAEHLTALAEGAILALLSVLVAVLAIRRLIGPHPEVEAGWYAFLAIGLVLVIDASRSAVSFRAAWRYRSAALRANGLHFASDLGGSAAVLVGLLAARAGYPSADSFAALLVAALAFGAAGRLMLRNIDVLMDRAPADAGTAARGAIEAIEPAVDLRRLRLREAGGRHFADVVIGVEPGAPVAQGHAVADAVEDAVEGVLPGADVVVHVEPREEALLRERALAAALSVPGAREVHNVSVLRIGDRTEVSLHLKLPGGLALGAAHAVASEVEAAIRSELPEVAGVQTHLEPLAETADLTAGAGGGEEEQVRRIVRETLGTEARELRLLHADEGLVVFVTLPVDAGSRLDEAHARASVLEERIRAARPGIAEVIVHTEP